jgi:glycosyltransferase involved in cell wall biosynthesis
MEIGIDASRAFGKEKTGTENYSHELLRALTGLPSDHHFTLYVRKGTKIDFELPPNFSTREIGGDFLWTQLSLSGEMLRNLPDVLFVPAHTLPFMRPRRSVVTMHGLEFRHCPECYPFKERLLLEINTLLNTLFASRIIAVSGNTKRDLVEIYRYKPEKIAVVYHGVEDEGLAQKKEHEGFNFLYIGRLEKRKNIVRLVRAFEKFRQSLGDTTSKEGITLTLAGKDGFGADEIRKAVEDSPYRKDISLSGYVPETEKASIYATADAFVFPSLYEGFGLPVMDAMSRGVPVICSDSSSLRELGEGAALLVDPKDEENIATAMRTIFTDETKRQELIRQGYARVKDRSWERCARETLEALLK